MPRSKLAPWVWDSACERASGTRQDEICGDFIYPEHKRGTTSKRAIYTREKHRGHRAVNAFTGTYALILYNKRGQTISNCTRVRRL